MLSFLTHDRYRRFLPISVARSSVDRLKFWKIPRKWLLVAGSPPGASPPVVFWLFTRRWCRFRFCALHAGWFCPHMVRSSTRRACRKRASIQAKVLSVTQLTKRGWVDIRRIEIPCIRRGPHGYRHRVRSDFDYRRSGSRRASRSCWGTTSLLDDCTRTFITLRPITVVLRALAMVQCSIGAYIGSSLYKLTVASREDSGQTGLSLDGYSGITQYCHRRTGEALQWSHLSKRTHLGPPCTRVI